MDTKKEEECCPKFDPKPWDDKIVVWDKKQFIKDKVFTLFYMPLNFGVVMKRIMGKVEKASAQVPDWLCLSDHTSKWNMDIYLAVNKPIADAENTTISGKFYCKVYEGAYSETGNWCKDFKKAAKTKGFDVDKWYMWYTTCPKCAKKYGKNYTVIISKVG